MRNSSISFSSIFLITLVTCTGSTWGKIIHVDSPHHMSRPIAGSINRVRAFNEGIAPPHSPIMTDDFGRFITPDDNGECSFMPEIVMLQDVSGSYEDDLLNLQAQMPALFQFFQDEFNGNVRFGVTTFIDSPLLGDSTDYCANVDLPLIAVNTPEAMGKAAEVFGQLSAGGGGTGDWLEGANTGIMRVAASNLAGWSSDTHDPITGKPIVRILVIGTDAAMHEAGWHVADAGLDVPPSSLLSHRDELNADINYGCNSMDYPDAREIGVAFKERGITPVILTGQPWFWSGPGNTGKQQFYKQYTKILAKYNQKKGPWSDFETGLAAYYSDFLKEQVRVDGIVTNIDNTSSNFVDVLKYAMREVTELTCRLPSTSTTEVPTNENGTDPPVYPPHSSTTQLATSTPSSSSSTVEASTTFLSSSSSSSPQGESSSSVTSTSSSLPSTSSSLVGQGSTTSTTTTTTTTTKGSSGGSSAIIIGSAAGGAAVAVAAAAAVIVKKFGISGFGSGSPAPTALTHDVDNVEIEQEREQVEGVTGDLFA